MSTERLRYDKMVEDALRGVVREALREAAAEGMPGDHHFYVTFDTTHAATVMPDWLRAQYPEQMTIVLQHQFWDLAFNHETRAIQVGLSFGGVPSKLVIPLDAVVEFADPHIRYGLRFQAADAPPADDALPAAAEDPDAPAAKDAEPGQVVSLDAFRRRSSNQD
jgi:hypothetical protein